MRGAPIRTKLCILASFAPDGSLSLAYGDPAPSRREPLRIRMIRESVWLIYKRSVEPEPPSGREGDHPKDGGRSLRAYKILFLLRCVLSLALRAWERWGFPSPRSTLVGQGSSDSPLGCHSLLPQFGQAEPQAPDKGLRPLTPFSLRAYLRYFAKEHD